MKKSDAPLHVKYLQTMVECLCMLGKVAAAGAMIRYLPLIHFDLNCFMISKNLFPSIGEIRQNLRFLRTIPIVTFSSLLLTLGFL